MWSRLRPLVEVGAAVGLAVLGVRLALGLVPVDAVPWPNGVANDQTYPHTFATEAVPDEPWTLVLGGSSAYYGIDRDALGVPARKVTMNRGYPTDLALALDWMLRRNLRPEQRPQRIVLGLNLASFIDRNDQRPHPCITEIVRSRPNPEMFRRLEVCEGALGAMGPVDAAAFMALRADTWLSLRPSLVDALVLGIRPEPWGGSQAPEPLADAYTQYEEGLDEEKLAEWIAETGSRYGLFDDEPIAPLHRRGLAEIDRICERYGIELVILSMPEPEAMRLRYSPRGRATFDSMVEAHADDVLDLFDAIPDGGFHDHAHMVPLGRALTSERVSQYLRSRGRVQAD